MGVAIDIALIILWGGVVVTGYLWWANARKKKQSTKMGKSKIGQR